MRIGLAYSREHVCHNVPMIWQPAGHHWYCVTCSRKEAPNEYREWKVSLPVPIMMVDMNDQPEPEAS